MNFCASSNNNEESTNISVTIKGAENKKITFAYYYEDKYFPIKEIKLDEKGNAVLNFPEKLQSGIYFFIVSEDNFFDILICKTQQNFEVETNTDDFIENTKFKNSSENENFYNYLKEMTEIQQSSESKTIINKQLSELWKKEVKEQENTFWGTLLKAMHVFEVPYEEFYNYVDFSEEGLLRTPFFVNILYYHLSTHIEKSPLVIINENDKLISKTDVNDNMKKYVTIKFITFYRETCQLGLNYVFIDFAEKYFLSPDNQKLDSNIVELVSNETEKFRFSTIGHIAYNFKVETVNGDSLSLIELTEKTFLFFWSSECDHCEDVAESIKENYKKLLKQKYDVLGINFNAKNKDEWKKHIKNKAYTWKNGIDTEDKYRIREYYYLCSLPIVYIIDNKNHKISNILYGEEQIIKFIENL